MAPSKEKQLNFLTAQRVGQRLSTDDVMKKLQSTIDQGDPGDLTKVRAQLRTLQQCFALVVEADEKIGVQLDDEEELQAEVTEAQQYSLKVKTLVSEAEVFVEDNTVATAAAVVNTSTTSASDSGRSAPKVKLPQLRLTPFSGDPLKWQEFWDSFESTVHNADLAPADKFKYLKEFLKGNALLLAEGYRMTADNYEAVVEQLQQRYGDKELAIQSHFDALLTLKPASGDINELQRVYDECEVHIRSLVTLDLDEDTFGRVFAPILKSKVPEHIRLELERRHDGVPWTLSDLRQLLRSEIHARRMSKQTLGANTTKPSDDNGTKAKGSQAAWDKGKSLNNCSSASALIADGQTSQAMYPCDFCKEMGHLPTDCPTYTDLDSRTAALKGNCMLCLRFEHKLLDCRTKHKTCFNCGAFRKHHRSLCPQKFGETESTDQSLNVNALEFVPQAQSLVSPTAGTPARRGLAVMQTALATVRGTAKAEKVRLLFDSASNRSFARADLLRRIGAKSHGVETLAVAGLGSERRTKKNYDSAELDLILADGSVYTLQVNGISSISSKVQKQAIDLKKNRVLAGLELADPIVDRPELVQVDILVGLDNYYSLVGSEQCRIGNLAVIDTKVGLIVSGYIPQDFVVRTSPSKDTTMMASAVSPDQEMHDEEIVKSADQLDQCLFDESVSFSDESKLYGVRWPYKPEHPSLPTNFGLAYGRFKSLVRRLQREDEKDGNKNVKAWICLFTCGLSGTIHLEVITDMTADQLHLALRRFVALRGKPDFIVCDNAKTLHTSSAVVDRLFREAINSTDVQGYTSNLGTDWKFIVELAPWMGGFYEGMVGLVKDRLRYVLQNRLLLLVEMQMVRAEVVSILNSRPLTYCEEEVGSTILASGHLLGHNRTGFITAPAKQDDDPDYNARRNTQSDLVAKWKRIQGIIGQFWETWQRQYLVALHGRYWNPTNRRASTLDAAVVAVVHVKEAHVPRGRWEIGPIIALDTSFDGIQRSAQVQLPDKNVLWRPLKLLCPVEVPESHDQAGDQVDNPPKIRGLFDSLRNSKEQRRSKPSGAWIEWRGRTSPPAPIRSLMGTRPSHAMPQDPAAPRIPAENLIQNYGNGPRNRTVLRQPLRLLFPGGGPHWKIPDDGVNFGPRGMSGKPDIAAIDSTVKLCISAICVCVNM